MGRKLKFVTESVPYFLYEPEGNLLTEAENIVDRIAGLGVQKKEKAEK